MSDTIVATLIFNEIVSFGAETEKLISGMKGVTGVAFTCHKIHLNMLGKVLVLNFRKFWGKTEGVPLHRQGCIPVGTKIPGNCI